MPKRSVFEESYIKKRVTGQKKRSTDQISLEKLRSLVRENGSACWVQGEYRFLFPDGVYRIADGAEKGSGNGSFGSYFWQGREIYVTYAEALHLYERLVLEKSGRRCTTNGLLRNLRRRFGDTFLAEYLPVMEQMKRKNRRRKTDG
jgi:hypothetical protein